MSRRGKILITALFLALFGLFAIGHQLRWMPAQPLEFCLVEVRPASSTTTTPEETFGTVIVEITNHTSATIVLERADLVTVPLHELEGTLAGDPSMPLYLNYGIQDCLGYIPQEITVPEGQTARVEIQKVWLRHLEAATQRNVVYYWQTAPRHRWERLMHWLGNHLPQGVPLWRVTPNVGISVVPLK